MGTNQKGENKELKRFQKIKELIPKSINKTLQELKCKQYDGSIKYLSETDFDSKCNDTEFWQLILSELSTYCKDLAREIFSDSQDVQLSDALKRCLEECVLLDIMKGSIVFDGNKKERLLLKDTVIHDVNLQNCINNEIGTKLDIETWKKTDDRNKVYMKYGLMIQKQAMKSGKDFMKLLKVHKIRKHKEKKLRLAQVEREKMKTRIQETEEVTESIVQKKKSEEKVIE